MHNKDSLLISWTMMVAWESVWIIQSTYIRSFSSPSRVIWEWLLQNKNGTRCVPFLFWGVLTEKMSFCKCIYEKNEIINMLFDHIIVIVRRYSLGVCSAIFLKTRLKLRRESKPHSSATLKIVLLEYRKRKRASLTR